MPYAKQAPPDNNRHRKIPPVARKSKWTFPFPFENKKSFSAKRLLVKPQKQEIYQTVKIRFPKAFRAFQMGG